jgi:NADH-ubiquinone oxidoreductase chain 1
MTTLLLVIDVLVFLLPLVFSVAFVTIIERKQLAAMQRRIGPNVVGYFGILQPFYILRAVDIVTQCIKFIKYKQYAKSFI